MVARPPPPASLQGCTLPTGRRLAASPARSAVFPSCFHPACESQVSRYRPPVCIYAMTPRENVGRQLMVNYGVIPVEAPDVASTDEMLAQMDRVLTERGYLKAGDSVVQASPWAVPAPPTS